MRRLFALLIAAILLSTPAYAASGGSVSVDPDRCAHHFEVTVLREATCAEKGLLAYTCSKCGLTYTAETLPDGEHDYELTETTATCTLDGDATYTCSRCGDTYTEPMTATGHVPEDRPATCTHSRVCANCGQVLEPATGHDYVYQYDAERTEDGVFITYGTWLCENCGRVLNATEGNAVYYYDLLARQEAEAAQAAALLEEVSGADADVSGAAGSDTDLSLEDASDTDAGASSEEASDNGGTGAPADLWLILSCAAVLVILVETVLLVRSLKKAKAAR